MVFVRWRVFFSRLSHSCQKWALSPALGRPRVTAKIATTATAIALVSMCLPSPSSSTSTCSRWVQLLAKDQASNLVKEPSTGLTFARTLLVPLGKGKGRGKGRKAEEDEDEDEDEDDNGEVRMELLGTACRFLFGWVKVSAIALYVDAKEVSRLRQLVAKEKENSGGGGEALLDTEFLSSEGGGRGVRTLVLMKMAAEGPAERTVAGLEKALTPRLPSATPTAAKVSPSQQLNALKAAVFTVLTQQQGSTSTSSSSSTLVPVGSELWFYISRGSSSSMKVFHVRGGGSGGSGEVGVGVGVSVGRAPELAGALLQNYLARSGAATPDLRRSVLKTLHSPS